MERKKRSIWDEQRTLWEQFGKLADMYPCFGKWLKSHKKATYLAWGDRFKHLEDRDIVAAFSLWMTGVRKLPEAYARDEIIQDLLNAAHDFRRRREQRVLPTPRKIAENMDAAGVGEYYRLCLRVIEDFAQHERLALTHPKVLQEARIVGKKVAAAFLEKQPPASIEL